MEGIELISFKIISHVGAARSYYMEALQAARQGEANMAQALIKQGEQERIAGHEVHFELLQQASQGNNPDFSLLLIHAEDQLMSAELLKIMADELVEVYLRLAH